jgi:hypothetical protein
MMRSTIALAFVGLLALGGAGCGKSDKPAAAAVVTSSAPSPVAPSPSPSPSPSASPSPSLSPAPPDRFSCGAVKELADVVSLRTPELRRAMEKQATGFSVNLMRDTTDRAAQVRSKVAHPQLKAVADEYFIQLDQVRRSLEGYRGDRDRALAEIDAMTAALGKASQQLAVVCAQAV